jgi:hypothetical protein
MIRNLLILSVFIFTGIVQSNAQLISGDVNKPVNQIYNLAAFNYNGAGAPVYTITAPGTCAGTGSVTFTWTSGTTAASIRYVSMHGGLDFNGNLIVGTSKILNTGNGFSATFASMIPGIYTFALSRDPIDDNLTTNNAAVPGDDYSITGFNDPTSDQTKCAVLGIILLPTDASSKIHSCTISYINATNCVTPDGSVTISGLAPSTNYNTSNLVNGSWSGSVSSSATGTLTISGLLTGIYPIRIRKAGEVCYRQFNIKVGNNSGIECFADNQLLDATLGTNLITGGNFGIGAGALPTNGSTDYTLVPHNTGDPQDSKYSLDDTTNLLANGFGANNYNTYRLRHANWKYTSQDRHLWACIQRTGDHTGSFNQNNGNTGNTQGYMMIVNANYKTDRVLNVSNLNLVAGNSYYYSFWAKNIQPFMPKNKNNGTSLTQTYQPIIPKLALAVNGIIYDFADLGATLEPASYTGKDTALEQMGWEQYNMRFVAPVNQSNSNITIYNFQQGGFGNDFVIDDVEFLALSIIGNRVWNDLDRDGIQDNNEPGMANVSVTLLDAANNPLQTTISDAYGYYYFGNLSPALSPGTTYKVQFTLPNGYSYTIQTAGGGAANNQDSDPSPVTGITNPFNISTGESELDIDCGLYFDQPVTPSSISDYVWLDEDNDGIQEATDGGMSNVTITLYNNAGTAIASTVSDAAGFYQFTNLTAGNYSVGITQPAGTICTGKDLGGNDNLDSDLNTTGVNIRKTDLIAVPANTRISNVDLGVATMPVASSSFGDFCWLDLNQNGIQNFSEPGLPNVKIVLFQPGPDNLVNTADDIRIDSTLSDALGKWQFTNLTGTRYFVRFYLPAGYSYTLKDVGSNDAVDSDINGTGFSSIIVINNVPNGFNYEILDVGFYLTVPVSNAGSISDFFWNDVNKNGIQNAGEFGVAGITVSLLNNLGTMIATTITNAKGNYIFANVAPGSYYVKFSNLPPGYQFTGKDLGGNDNLDSDVDINTGTTSIFTILNNQNINNIDAGMRQVPFVGNSSIGNIVWFDLNNDGIQQPNETGVPDIIVNIREAGADGLMGTADDVNRSTMTNSLGQFMVNGLPMGLYRVEFSLIPLTVTLSPKDAGTDDNLDSDGNPISLFTSITDNFSLFSGEDKVNIGLGLVPAATSNRIGNWVWSDKNGNGLQDAGENRGVQSVVVQLLDATGNLIDKDFFTAGIQPYQTVTNPAGYWSFVGIPDGTYIPRFSFLPTGYRLSPNKVGVNNTIDSDVLGNGRSTISVTVNNLSRVNYDIDLGLTPVCAVLGDYVWNDANADGIQDPTETGIVGATATVYNSAGVALGSAVTDAAGLYYFPNLSDGSYYLSYSNYPQGMEYTIMETDPYANNGSNVNPASGFTNTYTFSSYGDTLHIDAGLKTSYIATVGDYAWFDANNNGLQDANESPLAGIIANLRNTGPDGILGNADDKAFGRVLTDGDGYYQFNQVPIGNNYYIRFRNAPPSSAFAIQNVGGGGANNNSKADASGNTGTFNLTYGTSIDNMDAGIINITILPVSYQYFTAEKAANGALLKWKPGAVSDARDFEILHSTDGFRFTSIGKVAANAVSIEYSFLHLNPATGNNYYKIIATDILNQQHFSETRLLKYDKVVAFSIFPNPAKDDIYIISNDILKELDYSIVDITGKTVFKNKIKPNEKINIGMLASGKYLILINDKNNRKTPISFIKN